MSNVDHLYGRSTYGLLSNGTSYSGAFITRYNKSILLLQISQSPLGFIKFLNSRDAHHNRMSSLKADMTLPIVRVLQGDNKCYSFTLESPHNQAAIFPSDCKLHKLKDVWQAFDYTRKKNFECYLRFPLPLPPPVDVIVLSGCTPIPLRGGPYETGTRGRAVLGSPGK